MTKFVQMAHEFLAASYSFKPTPLRGFTRGVTLRYSAARPCAARLHSGVRRSWAHTYSSGEEVRVGDIVDVGQGNGPKMQFVVVIASGEAAAAFSANERAYLGKGVELQDTKVFGLLHLEELEHEQILPGRA